MERVPDPKLQPDEPEVVYANLRAVIIYKPRRGDKDQEQALEGALCELGQAVRRMRQWGSDAELEDYELIGFERA